MPFLHEALDCDMTCCLHKGLENAYMRVLPVTSPESSHEKNNSRCVVTVPFVVAPRVFFFFLFPCFSKNKMRRTAGWQKYFLPSWDGVSPPRLPGTER